MRRVLNCKLENIKMDFFAYSFTYSRIKCDNNNRCFNSLFSLRFVFKVCINGLESIEK